MFLKLSASNRRISEEPGEVVVGSVPRDDPVAGPLVELLSGDGVVVPYCVALAGVPGVCGGRNPCEVIPGMVVDGVTVEDVGVCVVLPTFEGSAGYAG